MRQDPLFPKLHFRNAQDAFADAIAAGRLSTDPAANNYAGHFMYMHSDLAGDHFKHIATRRYLAPVAGIVAALAPVVAQAHEIAHILHSHMDPLSVVLLVALIIGGCYVNRH